MGFFDDFIVSKIDQFENAVNKVSDELTQTSDRVEQGSRHIDTAIDRTTQRVSGSADTIERGSQKLDDSIRTTVSGVAAASDSTSKLGSTDAATASDDHAESDKKDG